MNQSVINEINNINEVIDGNIGEKDYLGRGLLSQNILAQLRNLVEDVIILDYNNKYNTDLSNSYENKKIAYEDLQRRCIPRFLNEFHKYLQSSKSHYTPDFNGAELLMQKYYYYLLKLKDFVKKQFNIEILNNISDYPLNNDRTLIDYYTKIAEKIEEVTIGTTNKLQKARYYIEKVKPFYINNKIYYEVTLSSATDKINKFDRMIAYTKYDIMPNYAITISYSEKEINLFTSRTSIKIINNWRIAIRSCEINNMLKIFGINDIVKSNMHEYNNIMYYMTYYNINLLDLVLMPREIYNDEKKKIRKETTNYIFNLLEACRTLVQNNCTGNKTIRYLLYTMRNVNIKRQLEREFPLEYMSNLCLKSKCFPFEKLPFVMSLSGHTPSGEELFMSQESKNCQDQLLARHILNSIEQKGMLYVPIDELSEYGDIDNLIRSFNRKLHGDQLRLKIIKENSYVFMEGYEKETLEIINKINGLTNTGLSGYHEKYDYWRNFESNIQDISEEKEEILSNLYTNSSVALIYGAAGTGKTKLISIISDFFGDKEKICLANTNTAVENLSRRVSFNNSRCYTITEFLKKDYIPKECDILIVDECSTVSNADILNVLKIADYKLLLLVGDTYQIESIKFGNWFNFAKKFVNQNSIYELTETFRSSNSDLLGLWDKVRTCDSKILEYIVAKKFSNNLDNSIFEKKDDDEIILCLGYDGLYGINQINKYLQDFNQNEQVNFGIKTYKIGDPVLFIDTKRFGNVLYNNLKGIITNIEDGEDQISFEIEIGKPLMSFDVIDSYVELIETKLKSSVIRITIDKELENDDDDDDKNNIVPFNIAYALSIHKAQGLEYNSVKVVITKDVENLISPNIFYTSITRAKKELKIYWTPETGQNIIEQIKTSNNTRDFYIFKNKYNL